MAGVTNLRWLRIVEVYGRTSACDGGAAGGEAGEWVGGGWVTTSPDG
jgi:hypothetical protein